MLGLLKRMLNSYVTIETTNREIAGRVSSVQQDSPIDPGIVVLHQFDGTERERAIAVNISHIVAVWD